METPKTLYCRHCREHRPVVSRKSIGIRFTKPGYWATYRLDCGHTAETPYKEAA